MNEYYLENLKGDKMAKKRKLPVGKWVKRTYTENGKKKRYLVKKLPSGRVIKRSVGAKSKRTPTNAPMPTSSTNTQVNRVEGRQEVINRQITEIEDDEGYRFKLGGEIPIKGMPIKAEVDTGISEDVLTGEGLARGGETALRAREMRKEGKFRRKQKKKESRIERAKRIKELVKK